MGKLVLYQVPMSPPVRSVLIAAQAIGIELEQKYIDLYITKEHLTPEYLKINPHHTVPTLDDNGHIVWDSHAIIIYLMDKYAPNSSFYPNDPTVRSSINQRMFFEASVLFPALYSCGVDIFFNGAVQPNESQLKALSNAYELFNVLFTTNKFLVGDSVTVADFVCITTVPQLETFLKIDDAAYPNIRPWIKRMEKLIPNYEELNQSKLDMFNVKIAEVQAQNLAKQKSK